MKQHGNMILASSLAEDAIFIDYRLSKFYRLSTIDYVDYPGAYGKSIQPRCTTASPLKRVTAETLKRVTAETLKRADAVPQ